MSFGPVPNLFSWLWQAFLRPHDGTEDAHPSAPAAETSLQSKLRVACERLVPLAGRDKGAAASLRALRRLETRLKRPPRLALLGDFNSGKSSLAQLLLGGAMPAGSVIPETRAPVLFRFADQPALFIIGADGRRRAIPAGADASALTGTTVRFVEAGLPLDLLRRVEIVDIPGTANPATAAAAHALLPEVVRNIHFALWCTPAPQAWKGNEQRAWIAMPPRLRAASILVATQADRLRQPGDREKVMARLRREAGNYFHGVAMISATQRAQSIELSAAERERAKAEGANMELWYAHGGARLWQLLMEAVTTVSAAREASAARVASRIAAREVKAASQPAPQPVMSPKPMPVVAPEPAPIGPTPVAAPVAPAPRPTPQPPIQAQPKPQPQSQPKPQPLPQMPGDIRDAILGLWSRRADAITARLPQKVTPGDALLNEFGSELSRFAREALQPRLEQHFTHARADEIAALFIFEPHTLTNATEGLSVDFTSKVLAAILHPTR